MVNSGETIKTDGFHYIGKSAEVSADIEAGILILEGTVRATSSPRDRIEMMSTGRLYGDLDTAKLQIADGVVFEGNCRMIKERTAPQAPPPAPKPREESTVRI
jgi:cytoskeletal protein CcmA (bactofilin family)